MSSRMNLSEYKKYLAVKAAYQTYNILLSKHGEDVDDAIDGMATRQLYKFLNDNGWTWSAAFEKWINPNLYQPKAAQS